MKKEIVKRMFGALPLANELRKGAKIRIDNPPFLDAITGETYVQRKIRENKRKLKKIKENQRFQLKRKENSRK